MKHKHLVGLLFLFLSFQGISQNVKFIASADVSQVLQNSYFTVEFKLENASGKSFRPPSFKNFDIISGPSTRSSHSTINGVVSSSVSYSYTLRPKEIGVFQIESASIRYGNTTLKTKPLRIEVKKAKTGAGQNTKDIFVRAIISDSIAYVGQQLILDYKIYTTLDVRSHYFLNENKFEGFYAEQLRSYKSSYKREIINGVEYYTKSLRKMALFPQQTGTYKIDPIEIKLGIATKNSSRGFFFSPQLAPRRVQVDGISIVVKTTPPAIDGFSGAIGQYEMQINSNKRTLTTDEAITVVMQIVGNGDNKTVQAPRWDLPEGLTMYDPNIIEDEVFPSQSQIQHRKTFEYLIVAEKPGKYYLNPTFSYFDPDSSKYITLRRSLNPINILKGSNVDSKVENEAETEFEPIYTQTKLKTESSSWHGSTLHIIILVLISICFAGLLYYNYYLNNSGKRDPALIRKQKAFEVANNRLKKAQILKDNPDHKLFYQEISLSLKKYFSDKHEIPAIHLNKDEFISALKNTQIGGDFIEELISILNEAETAIYSPVTPTSKEETLNKTINLISRLET